MHPLLHLIATKPELLADHAEAYSELVGEEFHKIAVLWKWRVLSGFIGIAMAFTGVALAGVAVMLWAVTPPSDLRAGWALLLVPIAPLVVAVVCLKLCGRRPEEGAFATVKDQLRADMTMLRGVSGS